MTVTAAGPAAARPEAGAGRSRAWPALGLRAVAASYLILLLVVPLAAVIADGLSGGLGGLWADITRPTAAAAIRLTLWTAALMTLINTVMGTLTAYVLVRYEFPGRDLVSAIIDLPLAIPTLVTGVMLVALYGPQAALGGWLKAQWGLDVIFAPPGIVIALLFVSFPFVVRAIQPVLLALERDQEEAAHTLGASGWATFWRVLLPALRPAVITGALLAFARALGEFGAIVVVAGNVPMRSQTAAVYVLGEIESENRRGASAVSVVMLAIAFAIVVVVDRVQQRQEARGGR